MFLFPIAFLLNWFPWSTMLPIHHDGTLVGCNGSNGSAAGAGGAARGPGIETETRWTLGWHRVPSPQPTGNGIVGDYSRCSQLQISAYMPIISLFWLVKENVHVFQCVCVNVIRYAGCWLLKKANKVCSLSLACVKMAWQCEFVCV